MSLVKTIRTTGVALALSVTFLATGAKAELFYSLDDWNTAADAAGNGPFTFEGGVIQAFFGACSATGNPCFATDGGGNTDDPGFGTAQSQSEITALLEGLGVENPDPNDPLEVTLDTRLDGDSNFSGACTADAGSTLADLKAGSCTSDEAYRLWVFKADNWLIAVLFETATDMVTFGGFNAGLSHLDLGDAGGDTWTRRGGDPVPLPPAVLLFGTALAGMGFLGRRRRKASGTVAA